jgi:aryl-alcohol dehydrogenase-like predicted oxidoreductase
VSPPSPSGTIIAMDTVTLGTSGLKVSPIAFGTWQLSPAWGGFDEREATAAVRYARQQGVNFFDTAQAYGFGESERALGRMLRDDLDHRRDELIIATKGGVRVDEHGTRVRDSSPRWLRGGVEQSLEALGVDHIDLYQVHWPDAGTPFAETGEALQQMVDEGKIRHVGVSNFGPGEIDEFSRTRPVETLQPPYAMLRREIESDILPYCADHDIGVLVYGPLAHGLLTGTMLPGHEFSAGDWRARFSEFRGDDLARNLSIVERLEQFARERGHTVSQLAIAWTLANPAVHVAIVGSRSQEHIAESLGAAEITLTPDDLAEIDGILEGAVPVIGPSPER